MTATTSCVILAGSRLGVPPHYALPQNQKVVAKRCRKFPFSSAAQRIAGGEDRARDRFCHSAQPVLQHPKNDGISMAPEQNDNDESPDAASSANQPGISGQSVQPDSGAETGGVAGSPRQPSANERFQEQVAAKKRDVGDQDTEEEIWSGGYSAKAMLGTWLALILVSIAAVAGTIMLGGDVVPWMATGIGLLVIWLIAAAVYAARRLGVHYELTSQRFIHQSGIVTRHTDRIEVIDIDDVSYQQGPIQRLTGIGSIQITSSDRSHPELLLVGIDDVRSVAGLIDDIRRTERRRRSLHIESI